MVSNGTAIDGEDFTAVSGTLNWVANDSAAKTLVVQIASDNATEGDETVQLALSNPSENTSLGENSTAELTITDVVVACNGEITEREITVDTTLSEPCYKVSNGINVSNAATLTVSPGVRLEFAAGQDLSVDVDGALNAVGTPTAQIIFTGQQATPGYWAGITFFGSNNINNELDYVTVEYGGGGGFVSANLTLAFTSSRLKIRRTTLRNSSGFGMSVNSTALLDEFAENTITGNEDAPVDIDVDKLGKLDALTRYSGNDGFDFISVSGQEVDTDQTWRALDVPYKLGSLISINSVLNIDAGATLIFGSNANLRVTSQGTLIARGTVDRKITFTAEQATPGYWHGIQFTFSASANELDHVIVEYGGGPIGNGEGTVTVFGTDGRLKIHNTNLENSLGYGFDFGGNITLDMLNVVSIANEKGAGILSSNDVGKLDKNSDYTGNTVDVVVLRDGNIDGVIDTSQTIPNLGVPYYVGNHNITGAAVDIESGVELSFASGGGIDVSDGGSLSAVGTVAEPIIFTGRQQISGFWNGIQFFTGSLANVLDNTVIEYGGRQGVGNTEGLVGVFFRDSRADVTNSILRNSATNGIWLPDNTAGVQTNNTFENIAGDNIFISN